MTETALKDIFSDEVAETEATDTPEEVTPTPADTSETKEDEAKPEEEKQEGEKKEATEDKSKEKTDEKTQTSESETNWDDDKNPYKKRHKDAGTWGNKLNQENIKLKNQLANFDHEFKKLNKKIDGTYDEGDEELSDESTPEEKEDRATLQGRIDASEQAAFEKYGKEYIEKTILNEDSPYKQLEAEDPSVWARVSNSKTPIIEAVKIMKQKEFFDKYTDDTEMIVKRIAEETLAAEGKNLEANITKRIMENLDKKNLQPSSTLRDIRSSDTSDNGDKEKVKETSLESLFPD